MKKLLIILAAFMSGALMAQQTEKTIVDAAFENAEKLKSGNYKEVLNSFLQLAAQNIVGDNKSIDFNSTLFALKLKANPDLILDTDYARERFSRNLQLNFKANFDDDYKYTGFTGGITWAAVNGRDRLTANFANSVLDTQYGKVIETIDAYRSQQVIAVAANPATMGQKLEALKAAVDAILNNQPTDSTDVDIKAFSDAISQLPFPNPKGIKDQSGSTIANPKQAMVYLNGLADAYYAGLATKPLLTLAVAGISNEKGKFNRASAGLAFLKGLKGADTEFDIKAKFTYADTAVVSLPRTGFNATAGVNFIIGKRNTAKQGINTKITRSFFEIKAYFEYAAIYKNPLPDEEKEHYLANADFRLRLTDGLWLPFTVKYDVENENFLGFLNLTFNFGDSVK